MKSKHSSCRALKTAALALAFALAQGGLIGQTVAIPDPKIRAAIREVLEKPGPFTVADMESLTVLVVVVDPSNPVHASGVSNLTGLESATNLIKLELRDVWPPMSKVTDLSPLAGLINLKELYLIGNRISDLKPLAGLTNLTEFHFEGTAISDFSPLAGLTNLNRLILYCPKVSDLSPLAGLTNLTELLSGGDAVADISPLAGLTNLKWLSLGSNAITDISPLAGLSNLTGLELGGSAITDISPLAGLSNLTELQLEGFAVTDLSPLAGLTNLTELRLEGSAISDLSPLTGMTDLTVLQMSGDSQITDISLLAGMIDLTSLNLGGGRIIDLSPLAGLTNLTWLQVQENRVSDISALTELTEMTWLNLSDNEITDIGPLAGMTALGMLKLHRNQITDISPLAGLTKLRDICGWGCLSGLDISDNYIDIAPGSPARQVIASLNAIEGLTVTFEPQNDPEPLIGGVPIAGQEDWFQCDWWGEYCTTFAPWLYHAQHGFLYRDPSSTDKSVYVYDDAMGAWCWTNETVYPFIYAFDPPTDNTGTDIEDAWLWCFEGERDPRVFGVVTGADAGDFLFFGP